MIPANPDMILSFSVSFFRREAALEQVNKSCDREHTRSVSEKDGNGTLFLVDMEINEVVPEDNKYIHHIISYRTLPLPTNFSGHRQRENSQQLVDIPFAKNTICRIRLIYRVIHDNSCDLSIMFS